MTTLISMALPDSVSVKLSSEAAGGIALTPVVVQALPFVELLELIVAAIGKHPQRIAEILRRGTLVSGATRYRWQGWNESEQDIAAYLDALPNPEPDRLFNAAHCVRAVLRAPAMQVEILPAIGQQKRLFHNRSFWDVLVAIASSARPAYVAYSYKERADRYRLVLPQPEARALREAGALLKPSALAKQVEANVFEAVDLFVERISRP
jgi:hypothetical protein